jgi:DNA-binding beta-propeller fold protein YncE
MKVVRIAGLFAVAALGVAGLGAQGPEGTLLVLNKVDATLAFVDPTSHQVVARVPTGDGPHEVVVSTDQTLAFVSNYGAQTPGSSLSVIDIVARKELRRVDVSPLRRPHGLAYADGRVYLTAEANRVVARYDPASNQIDWVLGTGQAGTHMVMANPDATRVITANIGSDSISVLERGTNPLAWTVTSIAVGRGPEGMDVSPDGRELWAAHSRDGAISIVDLAAKRVTGTVDAQTRRSNRLKFTADGKLVLITDLDAGELVILGAADRKPVKRITLGAAPEGILIPPGSSRAYIAVNGDNQVAVLDLDTLEVIARIAPGNGPDGLAWVAGR